MSKFRTNLFMLGSDITVVKATIERKPLAWEKSQIAYVNCNTIWLLSFNNWGNLSSKDSDKACAITGQWDFVQFCTGAPIFRLQNSSLSLVLASRLHMGEHIGAFS